MTNKKRQISLSDILDGINQDKSKKLTEEELDELEEFLYYACLESAHDFFSKN